MNTQQNRVVQMYRRVLGWFGTNLSLVTQSSSASQPALAAQVDALTGIVERATNLATEQQTQYAQSQLIAKDEREQRRLLLATHMATIAKVARALVGKVPGIGILAMPRRNVNTTTLLTWASSMARKAEIYKTVLVEHGLPADFIEQLDAAVAALKSSLDARGEARAARSGATRGLESELALGRRVIEILDATLIRALADNPAKMAEWRHVKRVVLSSTSPRQTLAAVAPTSSVIQTTPRQIQVTSGAAQGTSSAVQGTSSAVQGTSSAVEGTSAEAQPTSSQVQKAA